MHSCLLLLIWTLLHHNTQPVLIFFRVRIFHLERLEKVTWFDFIAMCWIELLIDSIIDNNGTEILIFCTSFLDHHRRRKNAKPRRFQAEIQAMIPWTILMKGNHPLKLNIQAPKTALQIIQNYLILRLLEVVMKIE